MVKHTDESISPVTVGVSSLAAQTSNVYSLHLQPPPNPCGNLPIHHCSQSALCTYAHEPSLPQPPITLVSVLNESESEIDTTIFGEALQVLGYTCVDFMDLSDNHEVSTYRFEARSESTGLSWRCRQYAKLALDFQFHHPA